MPRAVNRLCFDLGPGLPGPGPAGGGPRFGGAGRQAGGEAGTGQSEWMAGIAEAPATGARTPFSKAEEFH